MKKINFAIIGCGRIAYRHIESIHENEHANLVAICDLNLERAESMNKLAKAKVYQDYYKMLKEEDIDVVNIMTPSGMHYEHAIDIINNFKKHVVIEKPVALRVEQVEEIIDASIKNDVKVFVVHQNRFNKAIQKIKSAIDDNLVGKISLATVRLRWSRGQAYYDRDPWRGTWALDGGALTNQAIHHIDLLQWLVGEVETVSAIGSTQFIKAEVEDTAMAWLKFKGGAIGAIEATTSVRPVNEDLEASISILGENGTLIVEGASVNKLKTWTFDDSDISMYSESPPNVYGFGHNIIIDNVVDTLNGKTTPLVSPERAINSIKLLNAIYSSIEQEGKALHLKDNPVSSRFGVISEKDEPIANLYRTSVMLGGN